MKVMICSRKSIEKLMEKDFPTNCAVISFYDPPTAKGIRAMPVDYKNKAKRLFQIAVDDIDLEILDEYGLTFESYFTEADELAEFIVSANKEGLDIICQCEYGQSRSAACAAAILEYFEKDGISIFRDYRYYPNQLIFNKLYEALEKLNAE